MINTVTISLNTARMIRANSLLTHTVSVNERECMVNKWGCIKLITYSHDLMKLNAFVVLNCLLQYFFFIYYYNNDKKYWIILFYEIYFCVYLRCAAKKENHVFSFNQNLTTTCLTTGFIFLIFKSSQMKKN